MMEEDHVVVGSPGSGGTPTRRRPPSISRTDSVQSGHASLTGINRRVSIAIPEMQDEETGSGFGGMSKEKKFTVLTFCFANFCVGAFYSLLAPFFPQEVSQNTYS